MAAGRYGVGDSVRPDSPHFSDSLQRWLNLEYHPLHTKWQDIEASAESDLRLAPADMS